MWLLHSTEHKCGYCIPQSTNVATAFHREQMWLLHSTEHKCGYCIPQSTNVATAFHRAQMWLLHSTEHKCGYCIPQSTNVATAFHRAQMWLLHSTEHKSLFSPTFRNMNEIYDNNEHCVYKVIIIFNNVTEFSIALPQIIFSDDIFSSIF
jgi:hypothetical protein